MEDRDFARALNEITDRIFERAARWKDWSWFELAQNAGISYSTVWRLGTRSTKSPHLRTVWRLAKAIGMTLSVSEVEILRGRRKAG